MASEMQQLIEIMAEQLAEAREAKVISRGMADDIQRMANDIQRMADDIGELKVQTAKNSAGLGEVRLSVMRLADRIEEIYHLDQRVKVLENIVLPKPPMQQAA